MTNLKKEFIDHIIELEGDEFTDDPDDSGGKTKYGITEAVARLYGYGGDIRDLPRDIAAHIYATMYWDTIRGDDLLRLAPRVAQEVADTSVNTGSRRAAIILQRALNILNKRGTLYKDLIVDGNIGAKTIHALGSYLEYRSVNVLLVALNCMQGAFYIELAERREKDERFVYGWLKNRVVIPNP